MDLKVLRYFMAIVDNGSFGKAAEQVHISQPALSKAIKGLEEELEVNLLDRGRRGTKVRLTPAGRILQKHANILLSSRQAMLEELNQLRQLERGHLKIGLSPLGSAELFAPIIGKFRAMYPRIQIELLERGGAEQEAALRNSEIELATSLVPNDDEFAWLQVRDDPIMLALSSAHPLAHATTLSLSDLADTSLVTFETTFVLNKLIEEECQRAGFTPNDITHVSQPDFGLALVAAGTGVMLLPKLIAERHKIPGVIIKPLDSSSLRWKLSVIWRKETTLSFAANAMMALIRERFSE
ncbi:MAG: LysR family transcriptional regulator [Marinomonas sp.]|jgi:DNA-binding transcriptional LysR family regulator|uniref:LysR family transcriptional regulator n=1 Tax=Marinomonas TaxID=28253 RepID=UPI0037CA1CD1